MPRSPNTAVDVTILMNSVTIPSGTSQYSQSIPLTGSDGYCSLFVQLTGSGRIDIAYELSLDNANWSQVDGGSVILSMFLSSGGPASDGKTFLYFNPPVAEYVRFKFIMAVADGTVTAISGVF